MHINGGNYGLIFSDHYLYLTFSEKAVKSIFLVLS